MSRPQRRDPVRGGDVLDGGRQVLRSEVPPGAPVRATSAERAARAPDPRDDPRVSDGSPGGHVLRTSSATSSCRTARSRIISSCSSARRSCGRRRTASTSDSSPWASACREDGGGLHEVQMRMLGAIREVPGLAVKDIAGALGITSHTRCTLSAAWLRRDSCASSARACASGAFRTKARRHRQRNHGSRQPRRRFLSSAYDRTVAIFVPIAPRGFFRPVPVLNRTTLSSDFTWPFATS